MQPDYKAQAQACNIARNFDDIDDSWDSLKSVIEFYGKNEDNFAAVAGPGYFNDPDEASSRCFWLICSSLSD